MATPTFAWVVNAQASPTMAYSMRTSQFGDGYKQQSGEGINNRPESWDITWTGNVDDVKAIMAFMDERAGWRSFFWTNPLGELNLYRCANPAPMELGGNTFQFTGTFEKHYAA